MRQIFDDRTTVLHLTDDSRIDAYTAAYLDKKLSCLIIDCRAVYLFDGESWNTPEWVPTERRDVVFTRGYRQLEIWQVILDARNAWNELIKKSKADYDKGILL